MKVVIDTNLWISFLMGGSSSDRLEKLFRNHSIKIVMSEQLESEIMNVVQRPKFRKYFTEKDYQHLLYFIRRRSEYHEPSRANRYCRDPKDDFLLELALVSNAHFLLTGDDDLLIVEHVGKCCILTLSAFEQHYKI